MRQTKRFFINKSKICECDELSRIALSWEDKIKMGGEGYESDYMYKCLTEGDLPPVPNASIDNYSISTIFEKQSNAIVGYYDLYQGYPDKETIWLSMMVIDKAQRGKGYGSEILKLIKEESKNAGFKRVCLGVYLKNWTALRFWTNEGFIKIIGLYGDKVYAQDNFATIALECKL